MFLALSGYTYLRSAGDEIFSARRVGSIEQALFGTVPAEFLQRHIYERDLIAVDFLGYLFHVSWFMVPYFAAFGLMLKARHRLLEFLGWVILTHYLGALFYLLLPVEPPWMEIGTTRVLDERVFIPFTRADNNPVAAFPSLHCALPMSMALFFLLRMGSRKWAAAFAGWGLGISFFVVYLGEHWVIDAFGGYALAGLVAAILTNGWLAALVRRLPGDFARRVARFNARAFPAPVPPEVRTLVPRAPGRRAA
jgi:hypothetical protein